MTIPVYITMTDTKQLKSLTIEGHLELLLQALPFFNPGTHQITNSIFEQLERLGYLEPLSHGRQDEAEETASVSEPCN